MSATTATLGTAATTRDLRRAGWGAIGAAAALAVVPIAILAIPPLLGFEWSTGAAKYDPVSNAGWSAGLSGLFEFLWVTGITVLCIGIHRAAAPGWARDAASISAAVWITGLALHAGSSMTANTKALADTWLTVSSDVSVRAMIGAATTLTQWGFVAAAMMGALAWTILHVAVGRHTRLVSLGTGIPAIAVAAVAAALCIVGIIPPALTFAQLALLVLVGIPLVRRGRRAKAA